MAIIMEILHVLGLKDAWARAFHIACCIFGFALLILPIPTGMQEDKKKGQAIEWASLSVIYKHNYMWKVCSVHATS